MNFSRLLNQDITYWGSPSRDAYGGWSFADPVLISGRWEDRAEEVVDDMGNRTVSQAVVYSTTAMDVRGWLALGDHTALTTSSTTTTHTTTTQAAEVDDPSHLTTAWPIIRVEKAPSVDTSQSLYKAYLGERD
jgi:hypothetical protein